MLILNCMLNLIGLISLALRYELLSRLKHKQIYSLHEKTGILNKLMKSFTVQIGYNPKMNSQMHVF